MTIDKDSIYDNYKLVARPSWISGFARVLDITGSLQEYNLHQTGNEADFNELKNDMDVVALDLRKVYSNYKEKHVKKK